ncbi:MAG: TIGR04076 family protein [Bacteroidales bacterium]|nr:TIGR04076 family protein [Bacteroidales bacterium]
MKKVRITAIASATHPALSALFENPIEHACEVQLGQQWVSLGAQRPQGLCLEAWKTMQPFVEELARGGGHIFGDWMRNPHSAMVSCNDGFRPVSFYIETIED